MDSLTSQSFNPIEHGVILLSRMYARIKAHKLGFKMVNQLSYQSGLALYTAWVQGLDYVECEGYLFGCFADGIWVIHLDTVVLDDTSKVQFMGLPLVAWGSNS